MLVVAWDIQNKMKITLTEDDFVKSFDDYNRSDNFTREARVALFDYLTDYEEGADTELELDPIAVCGEYTEYESAWDAMAAYQPDDMPTVDNSEGMDLIELEAAQQALALDWLQSQTTVIEVGNTGRVVIADF